MVVPKGVNKPPDPATEHIAAVIDYRRSCRRPGGPGGVGLVSLLSLKMVPSKCKIHPESSSGRPLPSAYRVQLSAERALSLAGGRQSHTD